VPERRAAIELTYFKYQHAELLAVTPSQGPLHGGTTMRLTIMDSVGPRTRQAAMLPSMRMAAQQLGSARVVLVMNGQERAASSVRVVEGAGVGRGPPAMHEYMLTAL
jgi:hypothetical protein